MRRIITGKVSPGLGEGAFFTRLAWVKQQCLDKLKFVPFPGTLNIKVDEEYFDIVSRLRREEGIPLIPPTAKFCQGKCFPIAIGSIKGAIVIPEVECPPEGPHSEGMIEVMAPVNIKRALAIKDGDEVSITIEQEETLK